MMNQTWMAHIPRMAPPSDKPKPEPHIPTPTLRSMRAGQHPMFPPKPAKVPPDRPPNYMDDGGPPAAGQPWWVGATGRDTRLPPIAPPVDLPAQEDQAGGPAVPPGDVDPAEQVDPEGYFEDQQQAAPPQGTDPPEEAGVNPYHPLDPVGSGIEGHAREPQKQIPSEADQLEADYRLYPEKKEPKWWQRALGGAAGFGAGWSNAASRTRHPIDIGAMEQNILYPGNRSKLEQWTSKTIPQTAIVNIEAAKAKQQLAQQKQNAQDIKDAAAAEMDRARGDYYRGIGRNPMIPATDEMVAASGGLLKKGQPVSQRSFEEMLKLQAGANKQYFPMGTNGLYDKANDRVITGTPRQTNPNAAALAVQAAKGDPDAQKALNLLLQQQVNARVQSRDPDVGADRQARRAETFEMHSNEINNQKVQLENQARNNYASQIKANVPEAQARATLQSTLQGIQDNYANIIRNRGGSAQNMEVGPDLQYRPRGQGAPPQQQHQAGPPEGTIIRNPRTGERKVMKGGQWKPLP